MSNLEWVALLYLAAALISLAWRQIGSSELRRWIPSQFVESFTPPIPDEQSLISKGEEIPSGSPTLLIVGGLRTQCLSIRFVDFFSNILTFGWLRFNEIKPEGHPLDLVLCFKNISTNKDVVQGGDTVFNIVHAGNPELNRHWPMVIPHLEADETKIENVASFFTPETSGTHELLIRGLNGLRLAGPHGVGGRRYRIPAEAAPWMLAFRVSSDYEYKTFLVSLTALAIALISLGVAFLGSM